MEELEEMLLEDILNDIDCQPWAEMTGAELEDGIFGKIKTITFTGGKGRVTAYST